MSEAMLMQGQCIKTIYVSDKSYSDPFSVFVVKIMSCSIPMEQEEITVTCPAPLPVKNKNYTFYGQIVKTEKYGEQFEAQYYIREIPTNIEDTIEFLSSGILKGIGNARAKRIVTLLGEDCIPKIINNPDLLTQVPGIGKIDTDLVVESLIDNFSVFQFSAFFKSINIQRKTAIKIIRVLGDSTIDLIKNNPYILINLVDGISFKIADQIAQSLGIKGTHPKRIKGLIISILYDNFESTGSTYANRNYIYLRLNGLLKEYSEPSIEFDLFNRYLDEMLEEKSHNDNGVIVEIGYRISLTRIINKENEISHLLLFKSRQKNHLDHLATQKLFSLIDLIEKQLKNEIHENFKFSSSQVEALIMLPLHKLYMITGGAGTGKSTIINALVRLFAYTNGITNENQEMNRVILLAPTGKAAKRLNEITNIEASTIHRFLYNFKKPPKKSCLFIVDEASMLELNTVHKLLTLVRDQDQIIFLGDPSQLPPIGTGQFFLDVLSSKMIKTIHLNKIHRQAKDSNILKLATAIRNNDYSEAGKLIKRHADMNFYHIRNWNQICSNIITTLSVAQQKGYTLNDIQILTPMNSGQIGVKELNQLIQNAFITGILKPIHCPHYFKTEFSNPHYSFNVGDRVIQLKNNKEKQIFNGDVGIILDVSMHLETSEPGLIIAFDGIPTPIFYSEEDLKELGLAYCLSIHKSQGSEYKTVLLVLGRDNYKIINTNLIYTALTRSKEKFIFIGDTAILFKGIERKPRYRCTALKFLLKANKNDSNPVIPNQLVQKYHAFLKKEDITEQISLDL